LFIPKVADYINENYISIVQQRMSLLFCTIFFLSLFPFLADAFSGGQWAILATHSSDNWAADQRHQPKCLDIPVNFTLCHGMQVSELTHSAFRLFLPSEVQNDAPTKSSRA
jgi:hypothetical protein